MEITSSAGSAENGDAKYQVIGVESSPYTVKVRAILRYRHLPYTWLCRFPQFYPPSAHVKPGLMPVVRFPAGDFRVDSTPIILALEKEHAERSLCPTNSLLTFYSSLIEDMADEWLTKMVYFFRFGHSSDRRFVSMWVTDDSNSLLSSQELERKADEFVERQVSRADIVGATPENGVVIEASFLRLIDILNPLMALDSFLFGTRPSIGDFGLFAQLHTLSSDPTPSEIIRERAPRLEYWVRRAHDLSGVDGAWQQSDKPNDTVVGLLRMAGDTYLPFLKANFDAYAAGAERFDVMINGMPFSQPVFRYHVKCFNALRTAFAALTPSDREKAHCLLTETNCLKFLAA